MPVRPLKKFKDIYDECSPSGQKLLREILMTLSRDGNRLAQMSGYNSRGVEATMETIEKMFDAGYLKFLIIPDGGIRLMQWNENSKQYE
jgi:hypothetical protein